jgi:hypothetical protein
VSEAFLALSRLRSLKTSRAQAYIVSWIWILLLAQGYSFARVLSQVASFPLSKLLAPEAASPPLSAPCLSGLLPFASFKGLSFAHSAWIRWFLVFSFG